MKKTNTITINDDKCPVCGEKMEIDFVRIDGVVDLENPRVENKCVCGFVLIIPIEIHK
jgi:hypothetical protein